MTISLRLPDDLEKRLSFLADHTRRTKTYYLLEMIKNGLSELEDYYLAAEILEEVRSGKMKTYSSSQVRKDLGLEH